VSEDPDRLLPRDEADLAALADGRLDPARRDGVLARVAAEPALAAALERQRVGVAAITAAAGEVSAPVALRRRVEAMEAERSAPRRRSGGWRARGRRPEQGEPATASPGVAGGRWRAFVPAAGLALAAVVAVVLVTGGSGGVSVDSVVTVATRPPAGVVATGPPGPLLGEEFEGVRYPNYAARFQWQPDGKRADKVQDRATRTVFYRKGTNMIAYTIVAGEALREPTDGVATRREGVELRTLRRDGRTVVTWQRQGHTCVLSGAGVSAQELRELASWQGRGLVRF
jgi:anti-sigma factor RsiW